MVVNMITELLGITDYYTIIFAILAIMSKGKMRLFTLVCLLIHSINEQVNIYIFLHDIPYGYLFNVFSECLWVIAAYKLIPTKPTHTILVSCLSVMLAHYLYEADLIPYYVWQMWNRLTFEIIVGTILTYTRFFINASQLVQEKAKAILGRISF